LIYSTFPLEKSHEFSTLILLQLTFYGHAAGEEWVNSKDPCTNRRKTMWSLTGYVA